MQNLKIYNYIIVIVIFNVILIILFILNFLGLIPPIKKVFNKILKKLINDVWLVLRIKKWYKIFRISILWDLTDLRDIDSIYITLSL
jgi:hypothetical protein